MKHILTELSSETIKTTAQDIIKHLEYKNVSARQLIKGKIRVRPQQKILRVEYYFEIVDYEIARFPSILSNIQHYEDFEKDTFHPYPVKNLYAGIALCKEFCKLMSIDFTPAHEQQLTDGMSVCKPLYLIIIERPY